MSRTTSPHHVGHRQRPAEHASLEAGAQAPSPITSLLELLLFSGHPPTAT